MPGILVFLGIALAIPLAITVGIFIIIPAAIALVAWAVIKYLNRPKPVATTAELHQQTEVVLFPDPVSFSDQFMQQVYNEWRGMWPEVSIYGEMGYIAQTLYEHENLLQMPLLS